MLLENGYRKKKILCGLRLEILDLYNNQVIKIGLGVVIRYDIKLCIILKHNNTYKPNSLSNKSKTTNRPVFFGFCKNLGNYSSYLKKLRNINQQLIKKKKPKWSPG